MRKRIDTEIVLTVDEQAGAMGRCQGHNMDLRDYPRWMENQHTIRQIYVTSLQISDIYRSILNRTVDDVSKEYNLFIRKPMYEKPQIERYCSCPKHISAKLPDEIDKDAVLKPLQYIVISPHTTGDSIRFVNSLIKDISCDLEERFNTILEKSKGHVSPDFATVMAEIEEEE